MSTSHFVPPVTCLMQREDPVNPRFRGSQHHWSWSSCMSIFQIDLNVIALRIWGIFVSTLKALTPLCQPNVYQVSLHHVLPPAEIISIDSLRVALAKLPMCLLLKTFSQSSSRSTYTSCAGCSAPETAIWLLSFMGRDMFMAILNDATSAGGVERYT